MNKIYKIKGMDCPSCATLLECELEDAGIMARVNFAKETLEVPPETDTKKVDDIVKKLGHQLVQ
jgi:copper chaperone CopZ